MSLNLVPRREVHPVYAEREKQWRFLRASYLGGQEWYSQGVTGQIGPFIRRGTITGTHPSTYTLEESSRLWRHERERDERYTRRRRASVYENIFRPYVDMQAASIAHACSKLELPASLEYLRSNIDRWGQDAEMFRFRRIAWSHVFQTIYVLFDKPRIDVMPASQLAEQQLGLRTYAQILSPLQLIDWSWNASTMEFRWALIEETNPLDRTPPDERGEGGPGGDQAQWTRLYRPGLCIRYRDGKEMERLMAPPFVPITVQFGVGQDPEQAEPLGLELNSDVADIALSIFNKRSWLTDEEQSHCFNQVFLKAPDGIITDETDRTLGNHTYIAADDMRFVAPDVAPMQHLMASIERDKSTMRQMMGLETKGEASMAAKSGIALQLEQQNVSTLFAGYATAAEVGERNFWRMAARMEGVSPDEIKVEYAKDFSYLDIAGRYSMIIRAILEGGLTGKAKAELQKLIFAAAAPDIDPIVRDAVFLDLDEGVAELELAPVMAGEEDADDAMGGRPPMFGGRR